MHLLILIGRPGPAASSCLHAISIPVCMFPGGTLWALAEGTHQSVIMMPETLKATLSDDDGLHVVVARRRDDDGA